MNQGITQGDTLRGLDQDAWVMQVMARGNCEQKTTFSNEKVAEEVFIEQPEGFRVQGQEQKVCKLLKALYGL